MRSIYLLGFMILMVAPAVQAQSNIDAVNKYAWGENIGWTNWRDANAAAQGVVVGATVLSGFVWGENVGWINLGDGTPGGADGRYVNANGTDFGVNIASNGALSGYGWGENIGWVNFSGGALAVPAQPARIECDGRLNGYVWGENVGWINLTVLDAGKHVALEPAAVPLACDLNRDGVADGEDIDAFVALLLAGGADWRDVCAGDLENPPDGAIDADDVAELVACLLAG